jgi:hypothetical protein
MRSLSWRSLIAATLLSGGAAAPSRLMFPQIILIRGPGLDKPVAIAHTGPVSNSLDADTLALLYGALIPDNTTPVDRIHSRESFEVAEFVSPDYWSYYGPDRKLIREPSFDRATHHSRIYAAVAGGSPVWEDPVVRPGGSRLRFYSLSPQGERLLASRGVRLR